MSDEQIKMEGVAPTGRTQSSEPEGYDAWFRRQVEAALHESNAPDAETYSLEGVQESMRLRKAARPPSMHPDPANYEEWFQREVEAGLKQADDPATVWISRRKQ